ncbi:uncharacterized protein LOC127545104 isoform X2 [Antechinus flavipes]|uniref:uncharacterized protein LOC127545104 isoform X2 n=1 Tax=Antechinus flavipes TaxID=38775 RepID=UPI0022354AE6|nr:uncharacterized protein LOC127545104 isoform X2 [Antechinus flavipes]
MAGTQRPGKLRIGRRREERHEVTEGTRDNRMSKQERPLETIQRDHSLPRFFPQTLRTRMLHDVAHGPRASVRKRRDAGFCFPIQHGTGMTGFEVPSVFAKCAIIPIGQRERLRLKPGRSWLTHRLPYSPLPLPPALRGAPATATHPQCFRRSPSRVRPRSRCPAFQALPELPRVPGLTHAALF